MQHSPSWQHNCHVPKAANQTRRSMLRVYASSDRLLSPYVCHGPETGAADKQVVIPRLGDRGANKAEELCGFHFTRPEASILGPQLAILGCTRAHCCLRAKRCAWPRPRIDFRQKPSPCTKRFCGSAVCQQLPTSDVRSETYAELTIPCAF